MYLVLRSSVIFFRRRVSVTTPSACLHISSPLFGAFYYFMNRCRVRTECLRRQLLAMLSVSPDCWCPPKNAPGWLEALMLGITTGGSTNRLPPSDTALQAHVTVLEVLLNHLEAGRSGNWPTGPRTDRVLKLNHVETGRSGSSLPTGPTRPRTDRIRKLFPRTGKEKTKAALMRCARRDVEKIAAWTVSVWGSTMVAGSATREQQQGVTSAVHRAGPCSTAQGQACLCAARLLAEVVEGCDLPVFDICVEIRDQMNSFGRVVAAHAAGDGVSCLPHQGLDVTARAGLVRALCRRPFCAELARVLLANLAAVEGQDLKEEARYRLLLRRVSRRAADGPGGDVLL